jgi:hypothetical protein
LNLFNADAYKALEGGVDCPTFTISFVLLAVSLIALAMSFVSCRSSVVVLWDSAIVENGVEESVEVGYEGRLDIVGAQE